LQASSFHDWTSSSSKITEIVKDETYTYTYYLADEAMAIGVVPPVVSFDVAGVLLLVFAVVVGEFILCFISIPFVVG
jgi:hypothetical protein